MRTLDRWKETYPALKIREIRYRSGYKKNDRSMIKAMEHFNKTPNKKSRFKIRKEIKLCKDFWGCYPFHYFRYKLYEKNREMTETELLDYVPEFFFYELFLPFYDSKLYWILLGVMHCIVS